MENCRAPASAEQRHHPGLFERVAVDPVPRVEREGVGHV